VYERVSEIGILRALGVGAGQVFALFLSKALFVGVVGAIAGYVLGTTLGLTLGGVSDPAAWLDVGLDPWLLGLVLLAAPALCALASLLPAVHAARQDPALVLQQE